MNDPPKPARVLPAQIQGLKFTKLCHSAICKLQFQVRKLFIGNLKDKDLTTDDLEDYFGKFGRIKDAVIMEKDGVSRG